MFRIESIQHRALKSYDSRYECTAALCQTFGVYVSLLRKSTLHHPYNKNVTPSRTQVGLRLAILKH